MPDVVFKDPIKRKKGMQTVHITMPNTLNSCSVGMLVMPKTDVTNVMGRKNIDTCSVLACSPSNFETTTHKCQKLNVMSLKDGDFG